MTRAPSEDAMQSEGLDSARREALAVDPPAADGRAPGQPGYFVTAVKYAGRSGLVSLRISTTACRSASDNER